MLKSTKTLANERKRKLSAAGQQQSRTQSQPCNLTQRRIQPQQQPQPPPQPRQQHPPQPDHAMVSPTRAKIFKLYMTGYLKPHSCTISIETICMNGLILLVSYR